MCTILVAWQIDPEAPLMLTANRDELLARPTEGPQALVDEPRIVGGRDVLAGGTWIAVAAGGRVAAVTNRRVTSRDPARRSRGEIPVLLLRHQDDPAAQHAMAELDPADYNPGNVLYASRDHAYVAHLEGARTRMVELTPGLHAVTTVDLDDPDDAKVGRLLAGMEAIVARGHPVEEAVVRLEHLLEDHGPDRSAGLEAACIHGDVYGTRSSSSVILWADGRITYRHAPGRPCEHPREDVSSLLLASAPA